MSFCSYYQAHVVKKETWFFVAVLRSYEHVSFDRTLDKEAGIFELFVPCGYEEIFVEIMNRFCTVGTVTSFEKLPNRLLDSEAIV